MGAPRVLLALSFLAVASTAAAADPPYRPLMVNYKRNQTAYLATKVKHFCIQDFPSISRLFRAVNSARRVRYSFASLLVEGEEEEGRVLEYFLGYEDTGESLLIPTTVEQVCQ